VTDTPAQPLQRWHDSYLLTGGAAAMLVGLMFVAILLGSQLITPQSLPGLRMFATPTIIHFVYVLVIATVAVVPTLTRPPLGIPLAVTGLLSIAPASRAVPFMQEQRRANLIDREDLVWYLVTPSINYLLLGATGIGLLRGAPEALNGLACASIVLLVNGIRNAWDLVLWFAVRTQSPSR